MDLRGGGLCKRPGITVGGMYVGRRLVSVRSETPMLFDSQISQLARLAYLIKLAAY